MNDRTTLQALADLVAEQLNPAPIARRLVSRREAAEAFGVSVDYFETHIQRDLRLVRRGRKVLVPVIELDRWIDEAAERTLAR